MNNHHLDFSFFNYPDRQDSLPLIEGKGSSGLLIIIPSEDAVNENNVFLEKILTAVKLTPLEDKVFLLSPSSLQGLPLAAVIRSIGVKTVINFGMSLSALGVRAHLPFYVFTRLGDAYLLNAHSLTVIRTERAQNKNEKAQFLWSALKAKFL